MKPKALLRKLVAEEVAAHDPMPYALTYSILTIHFAEGSVPPAISIPYQPWENRTDVNLPYRLVPADELAGIPDPTKPER